MTERSQKTVLFFGFYDKTYSRTKVLRNGFERNGWLVEECHVDPRYNRGVAKYLTLLRAGLLARKRKYDLILVGFPGHIAVPIARFLFGPKILFDAFLSLYESNVCDRKLYTASSLRGRKDRMLDTWGCRLAGKVLLDTQGNIEYFVREFGLPRGKFIRVFVGADDTIFFPSVSAEDDKFTVHFHGTFIPVQGVSHIIEAAHILRDEEIQFRIIGSGQESKVIDAEIAHLGLKKVERIAKVPVESIPGYMARAHVTLGLFGPIDRALRAVPNKVYEAMAMGKAIITEDGSGIRELPNPEKAFALVPPADGKAIAEAVLALKANEAKRKGFGDAARKLFEGELLPEMLVKKLINDCGV